MRKSERIDAIARFEKGSSYNQIASHFGCGRTQIYETIKHKEELKEKWEAGKQGKSMKVYKGNPMKYKEIDEKLWEFYLMARQKNLPINGPMLQTQANHLATTLTGNDDFTASQGWLGKWLTRHNLVFGKLSGESGDVPAEAVTDFKARIPTICEGYEPENIFNLDEAGLSWREFPSKGYIKKGEKAHGSKKRKDRITMVLCCSMTGEKLMATVIGRAEKPRAFRGVPKHMFKIRYSYNKKAWMDSKEFTAFLNWWNAKLSINKRKVFLLVDNAPGHPNLKMSHIKVSYLPKNTTSKLQPLDQGVIAQMKALYMKKLLNYCRYRIETADNLQEILKSVDMLDAVQWIGDCWATITSETIVKCWQECGFKPTPDAPEDEEETDNTIEPIAPPDNFADMNLDFTWEELIHMDDNLPTGPEPTPYTNNLTGHEAEVHMNLHLSDSEDDEDLEDTPADAPTLKPDYMPSKLKHLRDMQKLAILMGDMDLLDTMQKAEKSYGEAIIKQTVTSSKQTSILSYFKK